MERCGAVLRDLLQETMGLAVEVRRVLDGHCGEALGLDRSGRRGLEWRGLSLCFADWNVLAGSVRIVKDYFDLAQHGTSGRSRNGMAGSVGSGSLQRVRKGWDCLGAESHGRSGGIR